MVTSTIVHCKICGYGATISTDAIGWTCPKCGERHITKNFGRTNFDNKTRTRLR